MSFLELRCKRLSVRVSPQGGALVDAWFDKRPMLRPYAGAADMPFNILDAACFPMVPFCGRIEGNEFTVNDQLYSLLPNTNADKHCLHGDGWLNEWSVLETEPERVYLGLTHHQDSQSPYHYDANLDVSVAGEQLRVILSVVNRAKETLPFGLGFHPYFALNDGTTIQFEAQGYRDEREDHLPAELAEIPAELDFSNVLPVPDRNIHLGFENWTGWAVINNPESGIEITMQARPACNRLQLFSPGKPVNGSDEQPYFCVEPMTHTCNAHRMAGEHGLQMLESGQSMQATMVLTPQ